MITHARPNPSAPSDSSDLHPSARNVSKDTMANKPVPKLTVEALKHDDATRKNIPTVEYQSVMQTEEQSPVRGALGRGVAGLDAEKQGRNRDLDPE